MTTYDEDVVQYVKDNVKGKTIYELLDGIKKDLGKDETYNRIKRIKYKYHLRSDLDCRIKKGNIPYYKGTKGLMKPNKTSFKKGQLPPNTAKVGDERAIMGYLYVKVKDEPKAKMNVNWVPKHHLIWEEYNGQKVPEDHIVIFANGNTRDFRKENLLLVNKSEHCSLMGYRFRFDDIELTSTGLNIVRLRNKLKEIEKNGR